MAFLYYLIIFLHVVACLFLIAVVLLQQGKGQDLASAFGGGGQPDGLRPPRLGHRPLPGHDDPGRASSWSRA